MRAFLFSGFKNWMLGEIGADDLRALFQKIKARGALVAAVHVRDIVKQIYVFAILHGEKVANPADARAYLGKALPTSRQQN